MALRDRAGAVPPDQLRLVLPGNHLDDGDLAEALAPLLRDIHDSILLLGGASHRVRVFRRRAPQPVDPAQQAAEPEKLAFPVAPHAGRRPGEIKSLVLAAPIVVRILASKDPPAQLRQLGKLVQHELANSGHPFSLS